MDDICVTTPQTCRRRSLLTLDHLHCYAGRWTSEEHNLFLKGLELHGKGWKKIAKLIKTRTVVQIRTHAQKYFQRMAKAKKNGQHDLLMDSRAFGKKVMCMC